jgi:lactoylglutathione lyase
LERDGLVGKCGTAVRVAMGDSGMVKLGFVALRCADLEESRRFYELVGLTFTEEQHGSGPRHLSTEMDGVVFELHPAKHGGARMDLATVGLTVTNIDGLEVRLSGAGVAAVRADGAVVVVASDPDGRRVRISPAE